MEQEVDMADLQITVNMLRAMCEAIEESQFEADSVDLHNLGYGPLSTAQLNKLLLEAVGPNSLEQEQITGSPINLQLLELLLENGADIECSDREGSTPLYRTVLHDQVREMEFLLERGARLDGVFRVANDAGGESCLSTAIQLGNHDAVRILLQHGGDLRHPVGGGMFFTAASSDVEMMRLLVEMGAGDVREVDPETGMTVCGTAFRSATICEFRLMVAVDDAASSLADPSSPDEVGPPSPLAIASTARREKLWSLHRKTMQVIRYLLAKGATPPSASHLADAAEHHTFLTLFEVGQACLGLRLPLDWANYGDWDSHFEPKENGYCARGVPGAADLLAGMLRRTRRMEHVESEGRLLRSLDAICSAADNTDYSVPRLTDLCVSRVRRCTAAGIMGLEEGLAELELPRGVRRTLALSDLDERFKVLQDLFRVTVMSASGSAN